MLHFDHSGVAPGTCITCHDGGTATGKTTNHPPAPNTCDDCHTTNGWLPVLAFDHSNVVPGTCATCHGVSAQGKPSGHFNTQLSCDSCHTTTTFANPRYTHTGPYPGDHRANLACRDCHTSNSQTIPWRFPSYQPDCAGCHANDFKAGPHKGATVSQLRDCAGSCHKASEHRVTDRSWD